MTSILPWIQIVLSVLLVISILLQQSDAGLGGAFGGDSGENTRHTRRGAERTLFRISIALAVLFTVSAILTIIL